MATTPNQNPVPSEDYANMRFNAGKFDEFMTSTASSYVDRLGITHLTVKGIQASVTGALLPANNLSDVQSAATSRTNLGATTIGGQLFTATTAANARTAILAAVRGANADITSLTGLTTPLSITQGGTGNATGLAATATALATARTFSTNLASTTAASFNGTANVTPGVTGVLPVANGGTGQSDVTFLNASDNTSISLATNTFVLLAPTTINDTKSAYASGVFTSPSAGYYHVRGEMRIGSSSAATAFAMLCVTIDDAAPSSTVNGRSSRTSMNTANELVLEVNCIISLSAGQAVRLFGFQSNSAAVSAASKTVQIIRVR